MLGGQSKKEVKVTVEMQHFNVNKEKQIKRFLPWMLVCPPPPCISLLLCKFVYLPSPPVCCPPPWPPAVGSMVDNTGCLKVNITDWAIIAGMVRLIISQPDQVLVSRGGYTMVCYARQLSWLFYTPCRGICMCWVDMSDNLYRLGCPAIALLNSPQQRSVDHAY